MCFDHDGDCDVWRESHPVARKRHVCCECGLPILPGERYQSIFSVFENEAHTHRTCEVCEWFRERIANHERAEGCEEGEAYPSMGTLEDALETEEYSDRPFAELIGMVPIHRALVGVEDQWSEYTYEERRREEDDNV